jgi:hypothetical protein
MKWVLIVMVCNQTDAWSTKCEPKEIATFPSQQSCLEAAKVYWKSDRPVCGIREEK